MRSNAAGDNEAQLGVQPPFCGGCRLVMPALAGHQVDKP